MGRKKNEKNNDSDEFLSDFPSKWRKFLNPEWVAKADAMSDEEIKNELLLTESYIMSTESDLEKNLEIQELKEEIKEKSGKYKDIIAGAGAQSKYLVHISKDRGKIV